MRTPMRLLGGIAAISLAFAACSDDGGDDVIDEGEELPAPAANSPGEGGGQNAGNNPNANGMGGGGGDDMCPYTGPPILDPVALGLQECPIYVCEAGGAHCVPNALIPDGIDLDLLGKCNKDMVCVPDPFIHANGDHLAPNCTAVMGLEGRCLSSCIPLVAEQAEFLDQGTCGPTELCVPCYDPLNNGISTTACEQTCDPGPTTQPPPPLPSCCPNGDGSCVPAELVPGEFATSLGQDSCMAGELCAPNETLDPTWDPPPCAPDTFFQLLGVDEGNCIPDCVEAVNWIGQGDCPAGYACAPCSALGEDTGACPEDW